jgi:hypothetical protein
MAIQAIDNEISAMKEHFKKGDTTAEDDIWFYDLDRAADNLEEVYNYRIETEKIINFPKYETLINRKRSDPTGGN